jgi:hypothetical protein
MRASLKTWPATPVDASLEIILVNSVAITVVVAP